MKRLCAVLVMLVVWPAWADFQDGMDAYNRGDYATTLEEWRPLAEQGDALAQNNLGWMYYNGYGVPQDYVQARMWFTLAAAQGKENARQNRNIVAASHSRATCSPTSCAASTGSDRSQSQHDGATIEHAAAPRDSYAWSTA
jgi:TPR repeat protein